MLSSCVDTYSDLGATLVAIKGRRSRLVIVRSLFLRVVLVSKVTSDGMAERRTGLTDL